MDKLTEDIHAKDNPLLSNTKGGTSDLCSVDESQVITLSERSPLCRIPFIQSWGRVN